MRFFFTFGTEDSWSRMRSVVLWEVAVFEVSAIRQGYPRNSGYARTWTHRNARIWRIASRDASVSSRRPNEWGAVGWFITVTGKFLASAEAMKWSIERLTPGTASCPARVPLGTA
jgi:hypothetical protein